MIQKSKQKAASQMPSSPPLFRHRTVILSQAYAPNKSTWQLCVKLQDVSFNEDISKRQQYPKISYLYFLRRVGSKQTHPLIKAHIGSTFTLNALFEHTPELTAQFDNLHECRRLITQLSSLAHTAIAYSDTRAGYQKVTLDRKLAEAAAPSLKVTTIFASSYAELLRLQKFMLAKMQIQALRDQRLVEIAVLLLQQQILDSWPGQIPPASIFIDAASMALA